MAAEGGRKKSSMIESLVFLQQPLVGGFQFLPSRSGARTD